MSEGGGFEGSKQALGEVSKQTGWINEQVGAGKLRLDPEAAEKAAKRCRDEADALAELRGNNQMIARVEGLGNYPDGKALQERFVQKATDSEAGALPLLEQMEAELRKLAEAFEGAAKDYRATDEQAAGDMQGGLRQ
ncbi:hypothetical protein [Salinifilum aidingensis]